MKFFTQHFCHHTLKKFNNKLHNCKVYQFEKCYELKLTNKQHKKTWSGKQR